MTAKSSQKLVHIGKVMDAHGIRGDLYLLVFSGDLSWLKKLSALTLKKNGVSTSFEIVRTKPFKKGFIAHLKGVDDRNQAEGLKSAELWVPAEQFVSDVGESIYLREILGFEVTDQILGRIGQIKGFSSNGIQDLLTVENDNCETFEVPFVKDFVTHMDFEKQKIHTHLPEGLLEINNGNED